MEDEGFVDDSLIEDMARDLVARHGLAAPAMLRERAHIAGAAGGELLAQIWLDMADTAEAMLFGLWPEPLRGLPSAD